MIEFGRYSEMPEAKVQVDPVIFAQRREQILSDPLIADILTRLERELSPRYTYHSAAHTLSVIDEVLLFALCDKLPEREQFLLAIAAAFHDAGFLVRSGANESLAAEFAVTEMQSDGRFSEAEIQLVSQMILDTMLVDDPTSPAQQPTTALSGYLLDADLGNYGRDDFFEKVANIQEEFGLDRKALLKQTLLLGRRHAWQTSAARRLREIKKQENLSILEAELQQL